MSTGAPNFNATRHHRRFAAALILLSVVSSSGCLHYLGRSHSSLSPRTVDLDRIESTLRAQDVTLSARSGADEKRVTELPGSGNDIYSANKTPEPVRPQAKVRLLMPRFTGHSHHSVSASNVVRTPPTSGHSVPVTADSLRAFMNRQSENAMSTGEVLTDQQEAWQVRVTPQTPVATVATPLIGATTANANQPSVAPSDSKTDVNVNAATFDGAATPVVETSSPASVDETERSVFDRLKGLYEAPRDAAAPGLWKRQIQKLQSPWSVFRDRAEPELQDPLGAVQTTEMTESPLPLESTNSPVSEQPMDDLLPQLIDSMRAELEAWPRTPGGAITDEAGYRRRQQDLRLLYLIADQPGEAIASMEMMSAGEQEFWQELMLAITAYRSTDQAVSDQERVTNTVGQLASSIRHLKPQTALVVQRFEICSRINSFGRIETFPSNDFDPGQPILLYVELENFGTERTPEGTYRTGMDAQLAIFQDDNSEAIETIELPNVSDESTSERRDYFQSFELNLPSHLATGRYYIRLRLRDRVTARLAESRIEFQVR